MLDTVAAVFGMSVDELVKLIAAFSAGVATILSAVARLMWTLRGARKRLFIKVRRLEDAMIAEAIKKGELTGLYKEMRDDQRLDADMRDGYES